MIEVALAVLAGGVIHKTATIEKRSPWPWVAAYVALYLIAASFLPSLVRPLAAGVGAYALMFAANMMRPV
jgi:hypothetical protein